jgi:hypothetical protein
MESGSPWVWHSSPPVHFHGLHLSATNNGMNITLGQGPAAL